MDSQLFLASKRIPGYKFLLVTFVVIFTWTTKEMIFMLVLMGQTSKFFHRELKIKGYNKVTTYHS